MQPVREQIVLAVLGILRNLDEVKTVRRTQPTITEVNGFHSEDFPAVAVTDRGFATEHLRRHPASDIIAKHTKMRVGITVYVQYGPDAETELNALTAAIVTALEAQQDLGIDGVFIDDYTPEPPEDPEEEPEESTVHTEMNISTVSCLNGQRSPFPPVFAETLDVEVLYHHTANVM